MKEILINKRRESRAPLFLYGNLGSGKTTFVQGLGKALGIKKHIIKSPTFVLLHSYEGRKAKLYHFDLYRIKRKGELIHELHECLEKEDGFIIVEWANRIKGHKPLPRFDIFFEHHSPKARKIKIAYHDSSHHSTNH